MNRMRILLLSWMAAITLFGAELAGKWNFVWQTEGGERRTTLNFKVAGEDVTVEFPGAKAPLRGAWKDGKLTITGKLYSAEAGEDGDFRLEGRVTGDAVKGTASWQDHQMTFTATKAD